jgi:hypothetical protein
MCSCASQQDLDGEAIGLRVEGLGLSVFVCMSAGT